MIKASAFKPAWYLPNRHLQTILPSLIHPSMPRVEKERVELVDGDFIDLAWSQTRSPKTLLILHGLEGSMDSHYVKRMLNYCDQNKIAAVLMHFRGCSGEPNRLLRSYHSGETDDLRQIIQTLKARGISDIALLGYSLGGNVTLKYMGEAQTDASVRCAIAVSVPLRLDLCANAIDQGFSRLYQHSLISRLQRKMQLKKQTFSDQLQDFPDPLKMQSFWQFDQNYTAPIHGFNSVEHYYDNASSRQYLLGIDKPTLILQSRDDPFMSPEVLPDASELSSAVELELSSHGGHVGFIQSNGWKTSDWLPQRAHKFLADLAFCSDSS